MHLYLYTFVLELDPSGSLEHLKRDLIASNRFASIYELATLCTRKWIFQYCSVVIPPLSFLLWSFLAFIQLHLFGVRDCNRFVCSLYIFYHINCWAKSIKKRDESITKRLSRLKLFYHPPSFASVKMSASNFDYISKQTIRNRNNAIYQKNILL